VKIHKNDIILWIKLCLMLSDTGDKVVDIFDHVISGNFFPNGLCKDNVSIPIKTEKFILGKKLGEGSYATVYEVYYNRQKFALKICNEKITNEICIHKKMNHPNIIQLYIVIKDLNNIYMLLDYHDINIEKYMKIKNIKLNMTSNKNIYFDILNALEYIHNLGYVHGDIKLSNILFDNNKIKLIDFGFSCKIGTKRIAIGTFDYLSPELMSNYISDDEIVVQTTMDIWALGIVFYEIHTGLKLPFNNAKTIYDVMSIVFTDSLDFSHIKNSYVETILKSMLTYSPIERATIQEIRMSIEKL